MHGIPKVLNTSESGRPLPLPLTSPLGPIQGDIVALSHRLFSVPIQFLSLGILPHQLLFANSPRTQSVGHVWVRWSYLERACFGGSHWDWSFPLPPARHVTWRWISFPKPWVPPQSPHGHKHVDMIPSEAQGWPFTVQQQDAICWSMANRRER